MRVRFYIDPETDRPHVEGHGVTRQEVIDVLSKPGQDSQGDQGARIALGRTRQGRYLKVIYKEDDLDNELFVITAYPMSPKQTAAYRRRMKRRGER
jgi:hypothetical protein